MIHLLSSMFFWNWVETNRVEATWGTGHDGAAEAAAVKAAAAAAAAAAGEELSTFHDVGILKTLVQGGPRIQL